jgi:hypothetical protein
LYLTFLERHPNISIDTPDFANNEIFSLNTKYLKDKDISNEQLFKLMINIFQREKRFNNIMLSDEDFIKYKSVIYKINEKINIDNKKDEFFTFYDFIKN